MIKACTEAHTNCHRYDGMLHLAAPQVSEDPKGDRYGTEELHRGNPNGQQALDYEALAGWGAGATS